MYCVLSTSLNRKSRSRRLANFAAQELEGLEQAVKLIDLSDFELPIHDGGSSHSHALSEVTDHIGGAHGVAIVLPIYRNSVAASASNLLQQTGSIWQRKVVGLISVASNGLGHSATLGFANTMMLEHRTFVLPDFVFVDSKLLSERPVASESKVVEQMKKMTSNLVRITDALQKA